MRHTTYTDKRGTVYAGVMVESVLEDASGLHVIHVLVKDSTLNDRSCIWRAQRLPGGRYACWLESAPAVTLLYAQDKIGAALADWLYYQDQEPFYDDDGVVVTEV